ncbi:P-loop containing nucleoside triphosphate hydrolase [Pseudocohnilembus persalinus]|uniref:p-loop containing nucleoside triphosphate hydrolase n=1 Tax=Pseudocohnilembus persalinus TaxID=266149 RepID=A0A0V0QLI5_PSEPJ|nr:P-loop containing nucleoside triphosphate hydrolase [Pseudocohnilembus persalinus]|eukprot:KRX03094.1 P-loop containing nucleoside triphosphate hydrolase [Pseudocohnilembus persalinus]
MSQEEQLQQEEEYEYHPPSPEDFEPFLNCLEKINKNPKKRGLHNKSLQVDLADIKKIQSPLFNNHHYGPLKNHNMFEELNVNSREENMKILENNLAKNILQSEIKKQVFQDEQMTEKIEESLKNNIKNSYLNDFSMKQQNGFVTSYKFDLLSGNYKNCSYNNINPDYKNFSFETSTQGKFTLKSQFFPRKANQKLKAFSEFQKEFGNGGESLKEELLFAKEQPKQKFSDLNKLSEQNLKIIKILSLNSSFWDDHDDQVLGLQRTFGEQGNYEILWNQISKQIEKKLPPKSDKVDENFQNLEGNQDHQLEDELDKNEETKYLSRQGKEYLKKLQNLQFNELDEWEEAERQQKEQKKAFEEAKDINSKFKIIRLTNMNQGTVGQRNTALDFRWAQEDEADLDTFYDQLPLDKFALYFPFELDQFQKRAILRLENRESILVCAHTSAGKTVVAEYAIALAQRHKRRCIYTSPIKALSNEKYRKLSKRFNGDVGIITGDVTLNPQASCLIVTTEILRNMLYKGNDMIRDIEWVIFDEVHYINNPERGVVWEETIIMLPDHINIVMLSATIPNHMDFADWVGRTKRRKIYVQKTNWRPVPLEHSIYLLNKFHVVKDKDGPFLEEQYDMLKNNIKELTMDQEQLLLKKKMELQEKKEKGKYKDKTRGMAMKNATKMTSDKFISKITKGDMESAKYKDLKRSMYELITHCQQNDLLPCVLFIMSKRQIQDLSEGLSFMNLVNKSEESRIIRYFDHAIKKLKPRDQNLPQLIYLRKILRKGLAVHHGDLIPIAKEIVEILFSEGLIKVLLATETFAMGLNMPTKTVIFHTLQKHDGKEKRYLNSSEYTQMAGRAGRRGLDAKGNVIIFCDDPEKLPQTVDMKQIIAHKGEQIRSKFKITYEVILNKLNSKELNVIDIMRQSFSENEKFSQIPKNLMRIKVLKQDYISLSNIECPYVPKAINNQAPIEDYHDISENLKDLNEELLKIDPNFVKKLNLPKFALVIGHNNKIELGIIIAVDRQNYPLSVIVVHELEGKKRKIQLEYEEEQTEQKPRKVRDRNYVYKIISLSYHNVVEIYDDKIQCGKGGGKLDIYNNNTQQDLAVLLVDKLEVFNEDQLLDPNFTSKGKNADFQKIIFKNDKFQETKQIKALTQKDFQNSKCHNCELLDKHIQQMQKRDQVKEELDQLLKDVDEDALYFRDNFDGRVQVLKHLKYIDDSNQPLIKASIGRELGDKSIYMCELIVENIIGDLKPEEIAALLSGFVCQYKPRKGYDKKHLLDYINKEEDDFDEEQFFSPKFIQAAEQTYAICQKIAQQEQKEQVIFVGGDVHDYIFDNVLNFSMARTIYEWTSGRDFIEIMEISDAQEGNIIRTILRLENLLKNFKSAAKIIGHMPLSHKIEICQEVIKRDIVFTQSLYYEEDKQII